MFKKTLLTRNEQRAAQTARVMAAATLELQLRDLVRRILVDREASATVEFQQLIQFAPDATRERILRLIEAGGRS